MSNPIEMENSLSMSEIRLSVRGFVEFLLRNGDIDNRHSGGKDAMSQGSRIHRMIQKRMGAEYVAEYPLRFSVVGSFYTLEISGRADGVITTKDGVVIDEIKGTYRRLERMKEPVPTHLAQAKCYAFMYANENSLESIQVRLTYCNMETEELRYFYENYSFEDLRKWFMALLDEYDKWARLECVHRKERNDSIKTMTFPFEYRLGQRELMGQVYQTIYEGKKLFLEAPTGVGKTISTIYPAVKSMGAGRGDKLFYLTAKTITRGNVEETFELLRGKGLVFKSVLLTSKEKICFMEKRNCNPVACEYAKGHYDRINDALYELLTSFSTMSRAVIEECARKYKVCPFELALDATLFADAVICDYNYLFDPNAKLQRFFADGMSGEYIFLVDEAHNLVDRGREMYSAVLLKESFVMLKREIKQTIASEALETAEIKQIPGQMTLDMTYDSEEMLPMVIEAEIIDENDAGNPTFGESLYFSSGKAKKRTGKSKFVKDGYADKIIYHLEKCNKEFLTLKRECPDHRVVDSLDQLFKKLERLHSAISDYLEENEDYRPEVMDKIMDVFFDVSHFIDMGELLGDNYVKYMELMDNGDFMVKLFCVNPSENLGRCMAQGISSVLFSATFLPIQYYKGLLGGETEDYEVYAKSVFDPDKLGIILSKDVTSKYTRRGDEEYQRISSYINDIVTAKRGNYLVFCPSYRFLEQVYDCFCNLYETDELVCLLQQENMNEIDRENFLARFAESEEESIIGFCVLGGSFSEGIDLKGDMLIGSIIVGTGIPQVCFEREILSDYFEAHGENGFDYAYRFPGMNKVCQAAGRVIRTADDIGVVALLDERFDTSSYYKLFPQEWIRIEKTMVHNVKSVISSFWSRHNI